MKFMKNQRNRSPVCTLTEAPCCENLFKQALFVVVEYKSHHHTFVLRAVKIILCGNVWSLNARFFILRNFCFFFEIHKFSRVINFQFTVVVYYLFICFMSNVNLFFRLLPFPKSPRARSDHQACATTKKTAEIINKISNKFMIILISFH